MLRESVRKHLPSIVALRHAWLRWRQRRIEAWVYRQTHGRIVAGPFTGLVFVEDSDGIPLAPKLLGTYERELFPWIRQIAATGYDVVINVGAGEGYYAVGLLALMPRTRAVAFESSPRRRALIEELASCNGVGDRLQVHGFATTSALQSVLGDARRPVILCDIEGGEKALLDPAAIPRLGAADMLVEVHDFVDPDISSALSRRFEATHHVETVTSGPRTTGHLGSLPFPVTPRLLDACSERRPCAMEWWWLRTRSR